MPTETIERIAECKPATALRVGDEKRYLCLVSRKLGYDLYTVEFVKSEEMPCKNTPGEKYTFRIKHISSDQSNRAVGDKFEVWQAKEKQILAPFILF